MVGKLIPTRRNSAGSTKAKPYDRSYRVPMKNKNSPLPSKVINKAYETQHTGLLGLDDDIHLYDSSDVESIAASSDSLFGDAVLSSDEYMFDAPSDDYALLESLGDTQLLPTTESSSSSTPTTLSWDETLPDLEFLASHSDFDSATPVDFSDSESEIDNNGYLDGIPLTPAVVFPPMDNSSYLESTVAPTVFVSNNVSKDSMYTSSKHKPPMWSTHIPKVREAPPRLTAPIVNESSSCCDLASPLGAEADATLFDFQPNTFGDPCDKMNKRCRTFNTSSYKPFAPEHNVVWAHAQQEHKRAVLNVLERARREDLKSSFHRLRDEIPELRGDKRVPKGQILKRASEFIKALEKEGQDYERQIQLLREKNQRLLGEAPINSLLGTR